MVHASFRLECRWRGRGGGVAMSVLKTTIAAVKFSAPNGCFVYFTRLGWKPEPGKGWAHGEAALLGRSVEDAHAEALMSAWADAKTKHGLEIEIVNPAEALEAARWAMQAVDDRGLRSAEVEWPEEEGR